MVLAKSKKPKTHMHHRVTKQYKEVYWPFLPIIFLLVGFIGFSLFAPKTIQHAILGKATSISSVDLLNGTNTERQQEGIGVLTINDELTAAAQAKANDMISRNYWSHNTPDGNPPWIFIEAAKYSYLKAGENLAYGFNDTAATISGWMNSPGHKANILDTAFTQVGFGFADSDNFHESGASTVVVAMYGRPLELGAKQGPSVLSVPRTPTLTPSTVTSTSQLAKLEPQKSSIASTIFKGKTLVATIAGITLLSLMLGAWAGSHLRQIRRIVIKSEGLALHHPILDVVVLSSILIGAILSQTIGFTR